MIERNAKAIGASIRNFGFVTVSGQKAGEHWQRARRTRDIWSDVAPKAGIDVIHKGLVMPADLQEAGNVLEAFLTTDMGTDCRRISSGDLPYGSPTPMNMYQCFLDLQVWPAHVVVKVDDTGVGIDEGREAGLYH